MIPALAIILVVGVCVNIGAVAWLEVVARRHVHQWEIEYAPTRLYLVCRCGAISDGWRLFEPPPGCERRAGR